MEQTYPTPSLGLTPLVTTLNHIIKKLECDKQVRPISLVIFTDGSPTEGAAAFEKALARLMTLNGGRLSVAITINLCTDEEDVVNLYNEIDKKLQALLVDSGSLIDVNDDAKGEANEIFKVNPWIRINHLNYIAKVAGCLNHDFDKIDERRLLPAEMDRLIRTSPYLFPDPASSELRLPEAFPDNVDEYKRVLTEAMRKGVARSSDQLKHLGKFADTEWGRTFTKIPQGSWIDINYVANFVCQVKYPWRDSYWGSNVVKGGISTIFAIPELVSDLAEAGGCRHRQIREAPQAASASAAVRAPETTRTQASAPRQAPEAPGPEEREIWTENTSDNSQDLIGLFS